MKFSQSQRTFHQEDKYTPPPNYYQLNEEKTKIMTGSLNGPSIANEDVSFGLSMRFTNKGQTVPGPATYFPPNKQKQQLKNSIKTGIIIREYKKQSYLGAEQNTPSIPYAQFNIDEQDLQYAKDLLIQEDLNKSALSTKKKNQGFTFPKSPRQFAKTEKAKIQETPLGSIPQYAYKLQREPKTQYRDMIRKTNEMRAEMINKINQQFVPSLQLVELIAKRRTKYTPGPGSYNHFKDEPRLSEPGISFSNSKRFSMDKLSDVGPGKYIIKQQNKKSISMSKSARNLFNMKAATDLQHRFYIDPYSKARSREETANMNKNHQHAFGSHVARFSKLQKQPSNNSELSYKQKKQSKLQKVVEMRLKKLHSEKMSTAASQGLLGIQSMISTLYVLFEFKHPMCDSPINLMMHGHTTQLVHCQQQKNKQLKDKLADLLRQLTKKKEQNLKYLKQIDNQQQTISRLNEEIQNEERSKTMRLTSQNSVNLSKDLFEKGSSMDLNSSINCKWLIKSTELPNKNAYLDKNNKSIDTSFQVQLVEKKLKMELKQPKHNISSYGNLYNRKSFSLNKMKFK